MSAASGSGPLPPGSGPLPTGSSAGSLAGAGRRVGPYVLLRELGRGSHGVVWLARREELQREFALKLLLDRAARDPELLRRFQLEAGVAGRLDHPGIVRVIDVGQHQGLPWLVMDYCPGPTLKQHLHQRGVLPPRAAGELVRDLARAVGAAHAQGVVHRDLKPANVILDARDGRPRVTDFGLAMDRALVRTMTESGVLLGTPYYMAPEQLQGARVDARADVWALGLILYQCLTGRRPFEGSTPLALSREVLHTVPRRPSELAPEVPPALEAVCLRALAKDPGERWNDGATLAAALDEALSAAIPAAERTEVRRGPPQVRFGPAPAPRGTRAAWPALAALPLLALGVVVGRYLGTSTPAPPAGPAAAAPPAAAPPAASPSPPSPPPATAPAPEELGPTLAPPPIERAPAEDLLALEEALFAGRFGREQALRLGELRARWPADPLVRYVLALGELGRPGREHEVRRALLRAVRAGTPLHDAAHDRVGRLCHMLGFERAGAWVAEQTWRDGRAPAPQHGAFLIQLHLKALPPVFDPSRAGELCARLLQRKPPGSERDYPETWMLHAHAADAAVGQRDLPGALRALERAREAPGGEAMAGAAELLRQRGLPPLEAVGAQIRLTFAFTPFLREVSGLDDRLAQDPLAVEAALVELAERARQEGQVEDAALALLRAAVAARRAAGPGPPGAARARPHLERAAALAFPPEAVDTRALVGRALAAACLELDPPELARAAALAEEALEAGPPGWEEVRVPDEQADALALLARARLTRGDLDGARAALSRAEALAPRDRRALDELARALSR